MRLMHRKSFIKICELFFWTATINKWQHLLLKDEYKEVVISSMEYLSERNKMDIFAFVIMPNHIHLIVRINEMNGKESAQGSFLKYTAHLFKKMIKADSDYQLEDYAINAANKSYEFWQRDSLAVHLYTKKVAYQKLDYIHRNPLADHWKLANDPCDYNYSSAKYYEEGVQNFLFIKDLREEF